MPNPTQLRDVAEQFADELDQNTRTNEPKAMIVVDNADEDAHLIRLDGRAIELAEGPQAEYEATGTAMVLDGLGEVPEKEAGGLLLSELDISGRRRCLYCYGPLPTSGSGKQGRPQEYCSSACRRELLEKVFGQDQRTLEEFRTREGVPRAEKSIG
ncbi:MAG: hypothetical protein JWN03_6133 [Nocardia sp.]|uniref:hypothetical protein n=1 Tax=Nocardia sp. TaxID=1821 RepID=UPI00260FE286|nr:hypothetical protein [Nocardia sp.]MCU1645858.1 hypothetical protein [Nocardia sp.]